MRHTEGRDRTVTERARRLPSRTAFHPLQGASRHGREHLEIVQELLGGALGLARAGPAVLCEGAAVPLTPPERDDLAGSFQLAERAVERLARQIQKEMDPTAPSAVSLLQ